MSESDRGKGTQAEDWVFPLFGILIGLFIAWGIGWLQAREEYNRQQQPAAYQKAAKDDALRACGGREPEAVFECVNEKIETAYQTAHDEQDLSAQQRAASSALVAAIVAFSTLLVSAVGVWFVKRTLDATLDAVEDTGKATQAMLAANEIAKRANRPWIECRPVRIVKADVEGDILRFTVEFFIKNHGQSPASFLYIYMHSGEVGEDMHLIGNVFCDGLMKGISDPEKVRIGFEAFPGSEALLPFQVNKGLANLRIRVLNRDVVLWPIVGCAHYYYGDTGTWHQTPFNFLVNISDSYSLEGVTTAELPPQLFRMLTPPFGRAPS